MYTKFHECMLYSSTCKHLNANLNEDRTRDVDADAAPALSK